MDELNNATECLKAVREDHEREYAAKITHMGKKEMKLIERLDELNQKKHEVAEANGNVDAKGGDLIEINAGGKVIAAKRSTLTHGDWATAPSDPGSSWFSLWRQQHHCGASQLCEQLCRPTLSRRVSTS